MAGQVITHGSFATAAGMMQVLAAAMRSIPPDLLYPDSEGRLKSILIDLIACWTCEYG